MSSIVPHHHILQEGSASQWDKFPASTEVESRPREASPPITLDRLAGRAAPLNVTRPAGGAHARTSDLSVSPSVRPSPYSPALPMALPGSKSHKGHSELQDEAHVQGPKSQSRLNPPNAAEHGSQSLKSSSAPAQVERSKKSPTAFVGEDLEGNANASIIHPQDGGHAETSESIDMNELGNMDGEHQKKGFRLDSDNIPLGLPQALARRGVTQDMFMADMQKIRQLNEAWGKASGRTMLTCCLTCGLSALFISIAGCLGQDLKLDHSKKLDALITDMNARYSTYGVTWSRNHIPGFGHFVSYEF